MNSSPKHIPKNPASILTLPEIKITHIRPVKSEDIDDVTALYGLLDSYNANRANAEQQIAASIASFDPGNPDKVRLIYVAELIDPTTLKPIPRNSPASEGRMMTVASTGTLIKAANDVLLMQYEKSHEGLRLKSRPMAGSVEFAAMITDPAVQGRGIAKEITFVRALVTRVFSGQLEIDEVFTELLPPYKDEGTKKNAWWTDMILSYLKKQGTLQALKEKCSTILDRLIGSDDELLLALVRDLDIKQRNELVSDYFPLIIDEESITPAARTVKETIRAETAPTLKNIERAFGMRLEREGTFVVDGGSSWRAKTQDGATWARVVQANLINTDSLAGESIMRNTQQRAIVTVPFAHTVEALQNLTFFAVNGIFSRKTAKVPAQVADLLGIKDGDELEVIELPRKNQSQ